MRIVCPSCAAVYDVPDGRLAPGQFVRCARCSANWAAIDKPTFPETAVPLSIYAETLPGTVADALAGPAAIARETEKTSTSTLPTALSGPSPSTKAAEPAVIAGWIMSVTILVGLGWAAVTWRNDVMRAWPPSERLFSAVGLPADR